MKKTLSIIKTVLLLWGFPFAIGAICTAAGVLVKRRAFQKELAEAHARHTYEDNPQYEEQLSIWRAYAGNKAILMFGDSHMYKAHWDELLNRGDIANQGIGSDVTHGYLMRITEAMLVHPRICFVEGGANDLAFDVAPLEIAHNIHRLVSALYTRSIICVLHTVPYEARGISGAEDYNTTVDHLNTEIKAIAFIDKLDVIDLNAITAHDRYLAPACAQKDGVHLTGAGYAKWKAEVVKILEKYKIQ